MVINKNLFVNTDRFDCRVSLMRDGKELLAKDIKTCVPPLSRETCQVPFAVPNYPGEYVITVSFSLKEDTLWARKGHEVAFGQAVCKKTELPEITKKPVKLVTGVCNIGV